MTYQLQAAAVHPQALEIPVIAIVTTDVIPYATVIVVSEETTAHGLSCCFSSAETMDAAEIPSASWETTTVPVAMVVTF